MTADDSPDGKRAGAPRKQHQPQTTAGQQLLRAMQERGWGWPDFDRNTNLKSGTVRAIVTNQRRPTAELMERISVELGLGDAFYGWPEYRLARARKMLDERPAPDGVGLEKALQRLADLDRATEALQERASQAPESADEHSRTSPQQREADELSRRRRRAGEGPGGA